MYAGTYEYRITNILKKFLKSGDTFVDVGANVGYVSSFALGLVGQSGEVHSFEPVPRYLQRLESIRDINPNVPLYINGVALGEEVGTSSISVSFSNIGWNTVVADFMNPEDTAAKIEVRMETLDNYFAAKNIRWPRIVKIDTEGYEYPIIKGFQRYLRSCNELPMLVVEIMPTAYPKLGLSLHDFSSFMKTMGYVSYDTDLARQVDIANAKKIVDVVFIPQA